MKGLTIFVAAVLFFGFAVAQSSAGYESERAAALQIAQAPSALADGEVRKVNKDAKKLTIKHGPIPSLDMPPMTMVYRVKDPAMLDQVKPGDKIKFAADKIDGAYTVTILETAK
jgi:Cu(I)/Ag(I) efflux system periplasmic protein CusF